MGSRGSIRERFITPVDSYAFALSFIVSPFTLVMRFGDTFRLGGIYCVAPTISFASLCTPFAPRGSLRLQERHRVEYPKETSQFAIIASNKSSNRDNNCAIHVARLYRVQEKKRSRSCRAILFFKILGSKTW